jgi:RNA polymerase sigma-B factor
MSTITPQSASGGRAASRRQPAAKAMDRLGRNRRVESYRQLVRPIALHYARCSPEAADDLIQVGLLGLIRAAELYRPERGVPFEAFARPHIRGAILHYLRDTAPAVRLPRRQAELQDRLARFEREAAGEPRSLRERLGLSAAQWNQLIAQRQMRRPRCLDAVQLELLPAPAVPFAAEAEQGGPGVEAMLALLEPRQRRVVRQVVLAGWSYRRLGAEMGVSPMTVQRLLRRGLGQLRSHLGAAEDRPLSSGDRGCRDASAARAC